MQKGASTNLLVSDDNASEALRATPQESTVANRTANAQKKMEILANSSKGPNRAILALEGNQTKYKSMLVYEHSPSNKRSNQTSDPIQDQRNYTTEQRKRFEGLHVNIPQKPQFPKKHSLTLNKTTTSVMTNNSIRGNPTT